MPKSEGTYNSFMINFLIDRKYRVARHLLLILFFVFVSFNLPFLTCAVFLDQVDHMVWYVSLALLVSYLGGVYLHLYVLLPELLLKNRYVLYTITVSLLIFLMILISLGADYGVTQYYDQEPTHYSYFYKDRIPAMEIAGNFFLYALLIAGTSITILLRRWMQFSKRKNELEKESLKTKLESLKDQINPEFLFNMLDEAGEQTPDAPGQASMILMKLSKLLRYQLYDGKREKVLLISEISFIENFLDLAKVRYTGLNFTVTKEGKLSRKLVPPLLFIPFAIYYVKLLPSVSSPMDIHFTFRAGEKELFFSCICFAPGITDKDPENGRELEDIRHRLSLLFKESYTLDTVDEGTICRTNLYIKL